MAQLFSNESPSLRVFTHCVFSQLLSNWQNDGYVWYPAVLDSWAPMYNVFQHQIIENQIIWNTIFNIEVTLK